MTEVNYMERLLTDINSRVRDKGLEFKIGGAGERAKIRVLVEGNNMYMHYIHSRFIKDPPDGGNYGYTLPCPLGYGHPCPVHGKDDPFIKDSKKQDKVTTFRSTDEKYSLIVWDYRDSKVKILVQRSTKLGMLEAVANSWAAYGSLLGIDILLTRSGTGFQTAYSAIPVPCDFKEKPDIEIPKDQAGIFALNRKMLSQLWYPDLMKTGDITYPSYVMDDPPFTAKEIVDEAKSNAPGSEENELLTGSGDENDFLN